MLQTNSESSMFDVVYGELAEIGWPKSTKTTCTGDSGKLSDSLCILCGSHWKLSLRDESWYGTAAKFGMCKLRMALAIGFQQDYLRLLAH
jgi:hypothetical protein